MKSLSVSKHKNVEKDREGGYYVSMRCHGSSWKELEERKLGIDQREREVGRRVGGEEAWDRSEGEGSGRPI
jgi:hypothetical protein